MKLIFIILLGLLTSCSANWHVTRALKKDPLMRRDAKVITTYLDTTFVTEGFKSDTIIRYITEFDTVVFENTKFRTEVIHDPIYKTIYVETECFPDTVYVTIPVEQVILPPVIVDDRSFLEKARDSVNKFLIRTVIIIVIILVLAYYVKRWFSRM